MPSTTLMEETQQNSQASVPGSVQLHVKSAPICNPEEILGPSNLKIQRSAPSYLFSLKDNPAPPFIKPGKVIQPKLLIGTIMDREEAVLMIAAMAEPDGLRQFLGKFLVDKKVIPNYNITERDFLISFVRETIKLAATHDFDAHKLACLVTVYLSSHVFFKRYYWQSPDVVWEYFKEILIRHTIEDSPDGQEVFQPDECCDILSHFHTLYLSNLPLVHIVTFGCYRLKFIWPFKRK